MFRHAALILTIAALFLVAALFAAINPAPMRLDLAFAEFQLTTSLAMLIFLGVGWLFGILCAATVLLKLLAERRQLRAGLRMAETELANVQRLSGDDAY